MTCSELSSLIDLYIDDSLPDEARLTIEKHLMGCAKCAHEVRGLEQGRRWLREAYSRGEPDPGFRERAAARLQTALSDVLVETEPVPDAQWQLPIFREADRG